MRTVEIYTASELSPPGRGDGWVKRQICFDEDEPRSRGITIGDRRTSAMLDQVDLFSRSAPAQESALGTHPHPVHVTS